MKDAEKLETWDGWVCNEGAGGGPMDDGYAENLAELVEHLVWMLDEKRMKPEQWPEFVFVCQVVPFPDVDIDDIKDRLVDELAECAMERLDGVKELEAALDAFNEANKGLISYYPDYKRVVRVPTGAQSPAVISSPERMTECWPAGDSHSGADRDG